MGQAGLLRSSNNQWNYSKFKGFGDFSETPFMWKAVSYVACASIMLLKIFGNFEILEFIGLRKLLMNRMLKQFF